MTNRERANATLNFESPAQGAVLETFFPWDETIDAWAKQGLPEQYQVSFDYVNSTRSKKAFEPYQQFFDNRMSEDVNEYEEYFGFDPLKRLFLKLPFHKVAQHGQRPPVENDEDWEKILQEADDNIEKYFSEENIEKVFSQYAAGHERGDFSIRFAIEGFFWVPRNLFGIEEHMIALYEQPELMHRIIGYLCDYYIQYLEIIFKYIKPDVLYIMEDLSGANGPMISPAHFDAYIGAYYQKLIPFAKKHGVGNVFVDTDGDFKVLIPNFIKAGVDGFLPMDVNAGMDIVEIRAKYPQLKFIGAFNKLEIAKGRDAIDAEFERIMPVIRQGGYIPGSDHQVAPSTKLEDYQYYIKRLREAMSKTD